MRAQTLKAYWHVVTVTFEITLRQMATDGFIVFAVLIQPVIIAFLGLWMLRGTGEDYAIFVVIGSGMTGLWTSLLFVSSSAITEERWTHTLEPLVAAPTPIAVVVFGKNLANVTQWLASVVFSYGLISLILGYPLAIRQPVLFVVAVVVTVISFVSFGLILATLFLINPEWGRWRNGLEYPVYMLAGFLFPVALLPGWTTPFSLILSPYWAARILHATTSGTATAGEVLLDLGMLALFTVIYTALAGYLFRKALYKVRVDATLSNY